MDEWKELIDLAVDLAGSEDLMDTGEMGRGRGWGRKRERLGGMEGEEGGRRRRESINKFYYRI